MWPEGQKAGYGQADPGQKSLLFPFFVRPEDGGRRHHVVAVVASGSLKGARIESKTVIGDVMTPTSLRNVSDQAGERVPYFIEKYREPVLRATLP